MLVPQESLGFMINLCARLISARITEALAPFGVTTGYMPTLLRLGVVKESTQAELAEAVAIEQPTMALTLRRMERDDLIERAPDPSDRRRTIIRLTPRAAGLLREVETMAARINGAALAGLDPDQVGALFESLRRIAANLSDGDLVVLRVGPVMADSSTPVE